MRSSRRHRLLLSGHICSGSRRRLTVRPRVVSAKCACMVGGKCEYSREHLLTEDSAMVSSFLSSVERYQGEGRGRWLADRDKL